MRVLLDEMLPAELAGLLPDHDAITVKRAGFTGLDNGALIRSAVAAGFEVLITADHGLPDQRNIAVSQIAVVLVPGSRLSDLRTMVDAINRAIQEARPGTVTRLPPTVEKP